jgi:hypothetical protein
VNADTQEQASALLRGEWDAWAEALQTAADAREAYYAKARASNVRLCADCAKPMPGYDNSQSCDGCHLPWGWDTPQGRRDRRAEQLDAEIERLRAERSKL